VVWLPEHARVRANDDGFVRKLLVRDGESVSKGQTLAVLEAPDLAAQRNELSARLDGLEAKYQQALGASPGEASAAEHARDQAQAELERVDERLAGLKIESPADGVLIMPNQEDLRDGFAHRGTVLAHLMTDSELQVRIAVTHADAALVRERHQHVEVQLAERLNHPVSGKMLREIPAATNALPTSALSDRYGGSITTDPQDQDALRTLEPVFLFDISIPTARFERAGGRAWVRIDHGREPLATQWGRGLRRLVLRHFSVQS
jgi:putative peptide zinc metalloprotease protein